MRRNIPSLQSVRHPTFRLTALGLSSASFLTCPLYSMLIARLQGRDFHGRRLRPSDARTEQVQARRLLDEFGWRIDAHQGAGALACDLERNRRGRAARRPRWI